MATILLAEDNEAVRLLTQAKLRHQFTVVTAANGREALDILNRQHVDLIVADVMMPVMDGYQLVRTLRAEGNEIPVLFLTALQSRPCCGGPTSPANSRSLWETPDWIPHPTP